MKQRVNPARTLAGEVRLPGDKSISHRAFILNGIAQGDASIRNYSRSGDCLATVSCLRALGVRIEPVDDETLLVRGVGREGLTEAGDVLNAENSGTTMRLLAGVLAAQPFLSVITGDESLRLRPMRRVIEPLRLMGARIWGRDGDSRAPLVMGGGRLYGVRYRLPVASAQVKSAVLLAGLFAQGNTMVIEPVPSRDHTEKMLGAMGARVSVMDNVITLEAGDLRPVDFTVPGDTSAAAFWLVAGTIHPQARIVLRNTGINRTRTGIIDVLRSMGAAVTVRNERAVNGEPVADLEVESSSLRGIEIGGSLIPRVIDEIPVMALAACVARGNTVIRDAEELRFKESDRISLTVRELSSMGAEIQELPGGMVIKGGKKLRGCACDSHGDHRLAMMLGVAGLVAEGQSQIDNCEAANISYPTFWQDLERLSAGC